MTLDDWNNVLLVASAVGLGLTTLTGAGALILGKITGRQQEERMVAAETRLAEAQASAEQAKKRAEEASQLTELARQQAAAAMVGAAQANEKAAALEKEAAEQRERAAEAEKSLLQLQNRFAPRRLSDEQRGVLSRVLVAGAKAPVHIICVAGGPEPCAFAAQLAQLLRSLGWQVRFEDSDRGFVPVGASPTGVIVRANNAEDPAANHLLRALLLAKVDASGSLGAPEGEVGLFVGTKE